MVGVHKKDGEETGAHGEGRHGHPPQRHPSTEAFDRDPWLSTNQKPEKSATMTDDNSGNHRRWRRQYHAASTLRQHPTEAQTDENDMAAITCQ